MKTNRIGEIDALRYILIFTGVGSFLYVGAGNPLPWILIIAGLVLSWAQKQDQGAK